MFNYLISLVLVLFVSGCGGVITPTPISTKVKYGNITLYENEFNKPFISEIPPSAAIYKTNQNNNYIYSGSSNLGLLTSDNKIIKFTISGQVRKINDDIIVYNSRENRFYMIDIMSNKSKYKEFKFPLFDKGKRVGYRYNMLNINTFDDSVYIQRTVRISSSHLSIKLKSKLKKVYEKRLPNYLTIRTEIFKISNFSAHSKISLIYQKNYNIEDIESNTLKTYRGFGYYTIKNDSLIHGFNNEVVLKLVNNKSLYSLDNNLPQYKIFKKQASSLKKINKFEIKHDKIFFLFKDNTTSVRLLSDTNTKVSINLDNVFKTEKELCESQYKEQYGCDCDFMGTFGEQYEAFAISKDENLFACYKLTMTYDNPLIGKQYSRLPYFGNILTGNFINITKNTTFSNTMNKGMCFDSGNFYITGNSGDIGRYNIKSKKFSYLDMKHHRQSIRVKNSKLYVLNKNGRIDVFNLKTNKMVLQIYAFNNGEFISLTPEGYFNASKNGAKHLNILTGPMQVSSIDQYYETFYRPDIVASVMSDNKDVQYASPKPTIKISDVKPAPQVAIINTRTSIKKEELKVTLKITPSSGGVGQIRLYLDGVLIKTDGDRGLKKKSSKNSILKSYTIKLPKGKHTLKAIVYNEANTMASVENTLAVVSTYTQKTKPNIYAVVVGINEYKNPSIALKYAVADAKLFAKTIKKRTKGLYGDVKVELLTSKKTTSKKNITKVLKNMENISPNDLFIFFVASHGMIEDAKYHMITSNVGALSTRGIKREAISQESLRDMIANIPTTKKFIILDTCNSGALGEAIEVALLTRGLTETTAMKVLSRAVGSTIISASSSSQEALEGYKGHGLLTYVLTDGLNGKADSDKDGYIKTLEIANFVEDTVPEIAEREFKRAQYPFVSPLGQGFPLVKVK